MKKIAIIFVFLITLFTISSCNSFTTQNVKSNSTNSKTEKNVQKIEIENKSLTCFVGDEGFINVNVIPSDANGELIWISSKPDVVTITEGYYFCISAGESIITVKAKNGVANVVKITVKEFLIDGLNPGGTSKVDASGYTTVSRLNNYLMNYSIERNLMKISFPSISMTVVQKNAFSQTYQSYPGDMAGFIFIKIVDKDGEMVDISTRKELSYLVKITSVFCTVNVAPGRCQTGVEYGGEGNDIYFSFNKDKAPYTIIQCND